MIRIISEKDLEINIVKNTFKIEKKNNSFSNTFSVYHSKFPFLILEDVNTLKSFGPKDLKSTERNKTFNVLVQFNSITYFGKINILEYLNGVRKCDLKFGSELLNISDQKITNFFGNYYFSEPIEYSERVNEYFDQSSFVNKIDEHSLKSYPEVDFNFKMLVASNFYEGEDFSTIQGFNMKNFVTDRKLVLNTRTNIFLNYYRIINRNSLVPMPYLMAMIERPLKSIGWKLKGDFVDDDFNRKIVHIPKVNNNCFLLHNQGLTISLNDFYDVTGVKHYTLLHEGYKEGKYKISVKFFNINKSSNSDSSVRFRIYTFEDNVYNYLLDEDNLAPVSGSDFETEYELEINADNINSRTYFSYYHPNNSLPESHEIKITSEKYEEKEMVLFHPTVNLKRFLPDWTYIDLLNNVKKLRNLKIDFEEQTKTLYINYNSNYIKNTDYVNIDNNVIKIKSDKNKTKSTYEVRYANQTESNSESVQTFSNPFKIFDIKENEVFNTSKEYFDSEGVSISLEKDDVFLTNYYNGQSLFLDKEENGSQYNKVWRDWINFLSNSSVLTVEAFLPLNKILNIEKLQKVYFNNNVFAVKKSTYQDSKEELIRVEFELENILVNTFSVDGQVVSKSLNIVNVEVNDTVLFGGSFFVFKVFYNQNGLLPLNAKLTARKLLQNPNDGIVYDDNIVLLQEPVVNVSSTELIIPFPPIDYEGWYEFVLEQDGVISNKYYKEFSLPDLNGNQKIILKKIYKSGNVNGDFLFEVSFDDINPVKLNFKLQEKLLGTGLDKGSPIIFQLDIDKEYYSIDNPGKGAWELTAETLDGSYTSNAISWFMII